MKVFSLNIFNGHELPQDKFKTVGSKLNLLQRKQPFEEQHDVFSIANIKMPHAMKKIVNQIKLKT